MADKHCPLYKEPCHEHRCRWYIQLIGKHPQTGEQHNEWGCAVEFLPVLLIENAQQTRQFAGAAESARNEARADTRATVAALLEVADEAKTGRRAPQLVPVAGAAPARLPFFKRVFGLRKEGG